jgi:hypothetical protein
MTSAHQPVEPLRRLRFDLEYGLLYRVLDSRQRLQTPGKTITISSKDILFEADPAPLVGKRVELSISWPALLDGRCRLKLVVFALIVRSNRGRVAAVIQRHEFRTQGGSVQAPDIRPVDAERQASLK